VLSVVAFLGSTFPLGPVTISAIDKDSGQLTLTAPYPVGTIGGYFVVGLNWPDNAFQVNKMVASIQAEPHAPVRGAW